MTRHNLAATALSLIILIFIGVAAARCAGGGHRQQTTLIVDTIFVEPAADRDYTDHKKTKKKKAATEKSGTANERKTKKQPASRNYLDETVD